MRRALEPARRAGESVGLVPTMGALHAGHRALIARARDECDRVVVTLFINPTQFNDSEDFSGYPRTFDRDLEICNQAGVDWLFAPPRLEMYPDELLTHVQVERLSEGLCGARRPGHFRGVATVVAKLFNIVAAERAYFGEKDYQQLATIRRMARDLNFAHEVVGVETVREPDGLALSSRNQHLRADERRAAAVLQRALQAAKAARDAGEAKAQALIRAAARVLDGEPLARVEYLELVDAETLEPVENELRAAARLAVAVWFGKTRLIDNIAL
jgi:pantoate--beta-alanine ligase